jgi:hypothetical protein
LILIVNRRVDRALQVDLAAEREIEWSPLPDPSPLPFWGSEDVEAVAVQPGGVYLAGGFGVARLRASTTSGAEGFERIDVSAALPSRHATALSSWRTQLAAGLAAGGLFVYADGAWSELRSGFGRLHVRALAESDAGELWIGAQEGLFRVGFAERTISRLHDAPVKSIAISEDGRVISGGEKGLRSTQGGVTGKLTLEGVTEPWIDGLAMSGSRIYAATALGLFAGGRDEALRKVAGGENVASIARFGSTVVGVAGEENEGLRRFDAAGRMSVDPLPATARRVFAMADQLLLDTHEGLAQEANGSWRFISRRRHAATMGGAHVGALGRFRDRLIVGFFDGGLAALDLAPKAVDPAVVGASPPGLSAVGAAGRDVWAVNALLDAGGALHIGSLRGAFRFDGNRLSKVEGPGAAFSLARTPAGVAIGFGEGVLLPEGRLLSAFHGLPGNQATALAASGHGLLVGTPSGIGYVEGRSVKWRAASGEGKLPHPWVTAVLPGDDDVLVATYGGGLVRRTGAPDGDGVWTPFAETSGLKINTGCLIRADGRVYAGTDGDGLFRLSTDGSRFERLKLALPSMRVTALHEEDGDLYIGTDEGLTKWRVARDGDR